MDRVLAARINQIARDDQSGAAELAIEALDALRSWLSSARNLSPSAILEVARALSRAHPEMAPLQRLSAEVAASSRVTNPASTLIKSLDRYRKIAATATQQISAHFLRLLPPRRIHIATYSYSSTAVSAIIHARRRISLVYCSEGRPGNEGRTTSTRLARAGMRVVLLPDVVLLSQLPPVSHVVFGADSILSNGFFNKTGSSLLLRTGLAHGAKVWVLADTLKFLPFSPQFSPSLGVCKPNWRFWDHPPTGVHLKDQVHELVPFLPGMRFLTERGLMTPAAVRKSLRYLRRNLPPLAVDTPKHAT
jgi:translation initiation factor 2B subunit (eIF-2B alpha/beta/delta family)